MKLNHFITILATCSLIGMGAYAADNYNAGSSGSNDDSMSGSGSGSTHGSKSSRSMDHNQGMSGQQLSGTISSFNKSDSTLILKVRNKEDTVKVSDTTTIMSAGKTASISDLKDNEHAKVWYKTEAGQKVATKIMLGKKESSGNGQKNKSKSGNGMDTSTGKTGPGMGSGDTGMGGGNEGSGR